VAAASAREIARSPPVMLPDLERRSRARHARYSEPHNRRYWMGAAGRSTAFARKIML